MSSTFGKTLTISVFGQSHSPAIGCVIEGLPAGFKVDENALHAFMARRAPGQGRWSTPRKEQDLPQFVSGLNHEGKTCGAPLCALIQNTNTRGGDYAQHASVFRPGHADWVADVKFHHEQDIYGGGHFSGRLTAPICLAGYFAKEILASHNILVSSHLLQVGNAHDEAFDTQLLDNEHHAHLMTQIKTLSDGRVFPTILAQAAEKMQIEIEEARLDKDSIGAAVETVVTGLPTGLGNPMFEGMENRLAAALFGIPAMKGLAFGRGFEVCSLRGSAHNDPYEVCNGKIQLKKNDAGGILGGITTGAPVNFTCAFKPTSSIAAPQQSVNASSLENTELVVQGRHDPCIGPRATVVVEALTAFVILDELLSDPQFASTYYELT